MGEGLGVVLIVGVEHILIDVVGDGAGFLNDVDWLIVLEGLWLFSGNLLIGVSGFHLFCLDKVIIMTFSNN